MPPQVPVFANVEVEPWPAPQPKGDEVSEEAIFFGTASILGGGYLIGTLWLAPYGVLLVLAGVVTLGFGLLRRITARLWHRKR